MKFSFGRQGKDLYCHKCRDPISTGEIYTYVTYKDGDKVKFLPFHINCYLAWYTEWFNGKLNHWWNEHSSEQPKLRSKRPKAGRPAKYRKPIVAHRLVMLINYYNKRGNELKVRELEQQLISFRINQPPDIEIDIPPTL